MSLLERVDHTHIHIASQRSPFPSWSLTVSDVKFSAYGAAIPIKMLSVPLSHVRSCVDCVLLTLVLRLAVALPKLMLQLLQVHALPPRFSLHIQPPRDKRRSAILPA